MHIARVEIENIKSHAHSVFEFGRGTTAITGENGAGKTTILEAIAWALFDVLDYKKEDFLRRGTRRGSVRIGFESSLDEREYVVYRDTATGYHVLDPALQRRVANKKDEVQRFLWQHLGLEPGTDLRALFRQAIGVPQGTFTAVFLEGAAERKAAFDKLLKVEEYRQAAERLRETSRLIDVRIGDVRETIARAEGELARAETVEAEYSSVAEQADRLTEELGKLTADLGARQQRVVKLDEQERRLAGLTSAVDRSRAERDKAQLVLEQAEQAFARAAGAAKKIEAVAADHARHTDALGRLKELERERDVRERLRAELAKTETAVLNVKGERKRLEEDLDRIQKARAEAVMLHPKATEQERLEKEIAQFRERAANAKTADERIRSIEAELGRMRIKYRDNQKKLVEAEERSSAAAGLDALEKRDAELAAALATLRANLERDEGFRQAIKDGLCPILSERCLNLRDGVTLEGFLTSQFVDIRADIERSETDRAKIAADLKLAREGREFLATLEGYRQRDAELKEEGAGLNAKKDVLAKQLAELAESERLIAENEVRLKALADPAARVRILEKEAAREPEVRSGLSEVEANMERLDSERRRLTEQLDEFRELDERWTALNAMRDATAEAHRTYIANETEAATVEDRKRAADVARTELGARQAAVDAAERDLASAGVDYDPEQHKVERAELLDVERRAAETRATFDATARRRQQLAAEIAGFAELRKTLATEFKERERLENVGEATSFIRDVLKEAAPRVARNYVHHVSLEANQMFREITGASERTLKWGEDYAVTLEEDGYERPFQSLSGGEQMAAALSIRLAILKQLSDIRIAFFDEPTTNLDAERRENFALEISRIRHFDQLFVISHDEAFDNYVDTVVSVERASHATA